MSVFLDLLIDFVYPKKCVGCGKEGVFLCKTCLMELPKAKQVCPECTKPSINGAIHNRCRKKSAMVGVTAWYGYRNKKVKLAIEEIKFGFNRAMIEELFKNNFDMPRKNDVIVPVPLHRLRLNWRGFNQAEEIGKQLAERMKVPLINVLVRRKNTKQQAMIKDKRERRENIEGAFVVDEKWSTTINGKAVLLVDDVFTSGESMRECAKVLMNNGVKTVWGFALAR